MSSLGERDTRAGGLIGLALACSTHVAGALAALALLQGTHALAATTSEMVVEIIPVAPDVAPDVAPPAPEVPAPQAEPEPPPPVPAPRPQAPQPVEEEDDPYADDAPPPAEATKVITAPSEPNEPLPAPDTSFASGEGTGLGIGLVAAGGTGDTTTYDERARVGNKPRKGLPHPKPAPQEARGSPDISRPPVLINGMASDCELPSGAGDDTLFAQVVVTVGLNGRAVSVEVVSDPGRGRGAAARACAMKQLYRPGRDADGRPVVARTGPVRVRFTP